MRHLESHESGGVEVFRSPLLDALPFIRHGFSTRRGGVSEGEFRSLNLGQAKGEDSERVRENRRRFFQVAEMEPSRVAEVRQVHGTAVVAADEIPEGARVEADGVLTAEPGVAVAVQTADCLPVLLADARRRAVAAVHAGRKGIGAGVLAEAVRRMGERFGSRPEDLVAGLGPAISGACYEVGEECLPPFRERYPDWRDFSIPLGRGKWLLDLPEAARRQLAAAGIPGERIGPPGPCTFSESARFFSYRRDGAPTGRLWAIIVVF
ncbi:MAG: peptidoglycan editing factor PgeF [Candidatus Tectomicrobia bacterium]|uniref:Purine nucleoside phosphorylase n=1 Tax=Tectimicrobiota bacterium TaxID=2528274 RepID=A0A932I1F8_UNCTE|nr:peptidoglycan editing factor PgeF [Candidatus Tectomicrobia bacterium]